MKILGRIFVLASCIFCQGFVFVNGPDEANLDVTEQSPDVEFIWNGKTPEIINVEQFLGGAWLGLSDEEIMSNLISYTFAIWNDIPGAFVHLNLGDTVDNLEPDPEDGIHVITVEKMESATSSAFAVPTSRGGKIVDCDISIGNHRQALASLAFTLTHEIGHCLGLGHPHTSYKSIMSYSSQSSRLALSADDMAGIIYLYPDSNYRGDEVVPLACGTTGKTSFSSQSNKSGASTLFLILLLFIPLLVSIYSRRILSL